MGFGLSGLGKRRQGSRIDDFSISKGNPIEGLPTAVTEGLVFALKRAVTSRANREESRVTGGRQSNRLGNGKRKTDRRKEIRGRRKGHEKKGLRISVNNSKKGGVKVGEDR